MKLKLSKEAGGIIIPRVVLTGPRGILRVNLILDTGAAYTMIDWDTAIALGDDPARQRKSLAIVTANGKIQTPLISIEKISILGATARRIPAICHDIPEMIEVSGLLGLSFLKHFKTTIDYPALSLSIS